MSIKPKSPQDLRCTSCLKALYSITDTLASQQNCSGKASTETFRKVARLIESTSQIDFLNARR